MNLSPATMMYAARGLGDILTEAGVSYAVAEHFLKERDRRSLDITAEQMQFSQPGQDSANDLEGSLLSLAVRHGVGRMTAGIHSLADDVERAWPRLDKGHRHMIANLILEARESGRLGMDVDARRWETILELAANDVEPVPDRW